MNRKCPEMSSFVTMFFFSIYHDGKNQLFESVTRRHIFDENFSLIKSKSNLIKSNVTLIMVDKPQPSYNLLNVIK